MAERSTPRTPDLEALGVGLAHRVVSLDKELYSTLSLFTKVYNWVPATYCWAVTLRWTSIPSRGGVAIFLVMLHAKETGISSVRLDLWFMSSLTPFTLLFSTVSHATDFSFGTATFSIYFMIFFKNFIYFLFLFYFYFLTSTEEGWIGQQKYRLRKFKIYVVSVLQSSLDFSFL